jgi:hypothetical protein
MLLICTVAGLPALDPAAAIRRLYARWAGAA